MEKSKKCYSQPDKMEHYEESIAQKGHDVLLSCHNAATMKLCGNKCMKITREKTMLLFKWYQTFCSSICHEAVKKNTSGASLMVLAAHHSNWAIMPKKARKLQYE